MPGIARRTFAPGTGAPRPVVPGHAHAVSPHFLDRPAEPALAG